MAFWSYWRRTFFYASQFSERVDRKTACTMSTWSKSCSTNRRHDNRPSSMFRQNVPSFTCTFREGLRANACICDCHVHFRHRIDIQTNGIEVRTNKLTHSIIQINTQINHLHKPCHATYVNYANRAVETNPMSFNEINDKLSKFRKSSDWDEAAVWIGARDDKLWHGTYQTPANWVLEMNLTFYPRASHRLFACFMSEMYENIYLHEVFLCFIFAHMFCLYVWTLRVFFAHIIFYTKKTEILRSTTTTTERKHISFPSCNDKLSLSLSISKFCHAAAISS